MKQNFQRLVVVFFGFIMVMTTSAYDFKVNGLAFDFIDLDHSECELVAGEDKYSGSITIPETIKYENKDITVKGIGDKAFSLCSDLKDIHIPNSVEYIGSYAFYNSVLSSLIIPNSVKRIGEYIFNYSTISSIQLSNSIEEIPKCAFLHCWHLYHIVIPDSVKTIGQSAFAFCGFLSEIIIPNSVVTIDRSAFQNCQNLSKVVIGDAVTTIDAFAFQGFNYLRDLTFGRAVSYIGYAAFSTCHSLEHLILPDSLKEVGEAAFTNCDQLIDVQFGQSLSHLSDYMFSDCTALKKIDLSSIESIGIGVFSGCTDLSEVQFGDYIMEIPAGAFNGCKKLWDIVIPGNIERIIQPSQESASGNNITFSNLKRLSILYSPHPLCTGYMSYFLSYNGEFKPQTWNQEMVETIEEFNIDRMLEFNISLKNVKLITLGENITKFQIDDVENNSNLATIISYAAVPPEMPIFNDDQYSKIIVKVPSVYLDTYQSSIYWKDFSNIQIIPDYDASIEIVKENITEKKEIERYNLNGQIVDKTYRGIVIIRFSDNTTKIQYQ